jgi:pyrroloquinoline quinone biosynthesis protein B
MKFATTSMLLLVWLAVAPHASVAEEGPYIVVLGIAQDAGLPQANCYQPHCMRAWENPALKRLASSIAVVDPEGTSKYLFDATPDMREQLYRLHIIAPDTEFSLDGVFLTHGHIGHYTGLMHFGHEASGSKDISVYAMPRMGEFLTNNGPWSQLVSYKNIRLNILNDGQSVRLSDRLRVTPMRVPHRDEYTETVGYRIEGPNRSALFIPDIEKWDRWDKDIRDLLRSVDYALLDATFFADGELGDRDMSEIGHPFVSESMSLFADMTEEERFRVIFIHMNHTNPLLIEGSPQQKEVESRGFRVARPGMRLPL